MADTDHITDYPGSIQDRQNNADSGGALIDRADERERFAEVETFRAWCELQKVPVPADVRTQTWRELRNK